MGLCASSAAVPQANEIGDDDPYPEPLSPKTDAGSGEHIDAFPSTGDLTNRESSSHRPAQRSSKVWKKPRSSLSSNISTSSDMSANKDLDESGARLRGKNRRSIMFQSRDRPQSMPDPRRKSMRKISSLIHATNWLRGVVSKKKKRHIEGGYNLDLSYITPRIIAMGFPCMDIQATFRNPYTEVRGFLDWKHGNKYLLVNLCSERTALPDKFDGRWITWPFNDHNPCPLAMLGLICESVKAWLDDDPENRIAIHCKAGKGRTGTVICALLLHLGICESATQSMKYYGRQRTDDGKGVTIRSQQRYIKYYAKMLRKLKEDTDSSSVDQTVSLGENQDDNCDPGNDEAKNGDGSDQQRRRLAINVVDPGVPQIYRLTKIRFLNAPKTSTAYFKVEVPVRLTEIKEFGLEDRIIEKKPQDGGVKRANPSALGKSFANRTSQGYESWNAPNSVDSLSDVGGRSTPKEVILGAARSSVGDSQWNTNGDTSSSSSSDDEGEHEEEEEEEEVETDDKSGNSEIQDSRQNIAVTKGSAHTHPPMRKRKAQSLDDTYALSGHEGSELQVDHKILKKSASSDNIVLESGLFETPEDKKELYDVDYSVLGGEEFRFGMVLACDSRDLKSQDIDGFATFSAVANPAGNTDSNRAPESAESVLYNITLLDQTDLLEDSGGSSYLELAGDTLMRFKDKGHNLFQFWFHTNFIPDDKKLILKKKELDCKAIKKNKAFTDDFAVELTFEKLGQNEVEEDKSDSEASDSSLHGRKRGISMFAFQRQVGELNPTPSMSRLDSFRSTRVSAAQRHSPSKNPRMETFLEEGGGGEGGEGEEKHKAIYNSKSRSEDGIAPSNDSQAVENKVYSSEVVVAALDE